MIVRPELVRRAQKYCARHNLIMGDSLGSGVHGNVVAVERQLDDRASALKVHVQEPDYCRERDVYRRLAERGVRQIRKCVLPVMLNCDDELWVIEMTIVTRPFVLDFAGAFLDFPPGFSDEVLADWNAEKSEQFGSRWPDVQAILRSLQVHGVHMVDVNPGNISFGD